MTQIDRACFTCGQRNIPLRTYVRELQVSHSGFPGWGEEWCHIGRLMLTVLGGLAEFERDLIRTRTGE